MLISREDRSAGQFLAAGATQSRRLHSLVMFCGLALAASLSMGQPKEQLPSPSQPSNSTKATAKDATQPGAKKAVKTAADLPLHTYTIEGKPSDLITSGAPFKALLAQVRADIESDLEAYDIQDRSTLQQFYGVLQSIATSEDRDEDALGYVEKIRALEQKESKKLMTGQVLLALVESKAAPGDAQAKTDAFQAALRRRVGAMPWESVREDVLAAKGRAEMISRDLVMGQLLGQIDPVVQSAGGKLSGEIARSLVQMGVMIEVILPLQPAVAAVYGELATANAVELKDTWTPTLATLTEANKGTPVTIGVWDSGVDVTPFTSQLYVNGNETLNGADDDKNGFVDDVNGVAFDLEGNRVPQLLHPINELVSPLELVQSHMKGLGDVQANIQSAEADAFKKYVSGLKPESVNTFLEDLGLYGNYSHGTHVAGIAAAGNPYARVLPIRITFDYRSIPTLTPNEAMSKTTAKAAQDCVDYMKVAGVRVVNMSWGGSMKDIEGALERKNAGGTPTERAQLARKLFAIERDGLEAAFKSAPDILFIAAAGNSDNDNEFAQMIPSGFNLPNLLTVGAVDSSGKATGFTTFGKNVRLYANGFEVNSYVPGGKRMKFSGTSMAAPNVTNLAGKLFALNPKLTPVQVIELMAQTSVPMTGKSELRVVNQKSAVEKLSNPGKY